MEYFKHIEQNRIAHGYIQKKLDIYKRFCNKAKRESATPIEKHVHGLESNLAKFLHFGSLRFLYKNLRILKKLKRTAQTDEISAFIDIYTLYIQCFIESKKGQVQFEKLLELRSHISGCYTFVTDIYIMDEGRNDFTAYKTSHNWHDIPLLFETPEMRDEFINGSFLLNDNRFNTQLAFQIVAVENSKKKMIRAINRTDSSLLAIYSLSKDLNLAVESLSSFLYENFMESAYVKSIKESTEKLHLHISNLVAYKNGKIDMNVETCPVLVWFEDDYESLKKLQNHKKVDHKKLRTMLMDCVSELLKTEDKERLMPFLPVFYDLAYDYISYPSANENGISGIFKKLGF